MNECRAEGNEFRSLIAQTVPTERTIKSFGEDDGMEWDEDEIVLEAKEGKPHFPSR
jgi:hypothetical protein